MTYDDLPLSSFVLDPKEVPAIYEIPLDDIVTVFLDPGAMFTAYGIDCRSQAVSRRVSAEDFSYMWDNYHFKVAHLARRYADGERSLRY